MGEQEQQTIFDSRQTVWTAAEIATGKLLALGHGESTVIGGDNINRAIADAAPQGIVMHGITQRWTEQKLQGIFTLIAAFVEQQILWAGFYPYRLMAGTGET